MSNAVTTTFFGADAIGFTPIATATQSGFQLTPNFVADTNGTGLFLSSHNATFSYGLQANDTTEIVSETISIVGNVTQVFNDDITAFDDHRFLNGSFIEAGPTETFSTVFGFTDQPSATIPLQLPGITANNMDPSGLGFTTELNAFAFDGDDVSLSSATFLYNTAPRTPTPPAGNFQFQNIDVPGAQSTFADGINNRGQITGFFQDAAGALHGYVMDGSEIQTFDVPNSTLTLSSAISSSGKTIVGDYADAAGTFHGFILADGVFTTLDFPGAIFTSILDLNEAGDVVGVYELPGRGGVHGFLQNATGLTSIDFPGQAFFIPFTEAFGINNRGNINGLFLDTNGNSHGFSLLQGIYQQIDVPGAATTGPEGLNEHNDMVGFYTDLDGVQHGYLQQGSAFTTVDFPGAVGSTLPLQINNSGTIVGNYVDDQGLTHSFTASLQPGSGSKGQGSARNAVPSMNNDAGQTCSPAAREDPPNKMRNPKHCQPPQ